MFDFAWSEIMLIGVVALIAIGPKDMPVAIRAISNAIKKMRRMAGEFQSHVDDMVREADLGDVKSSINELRSLNLKQTVRKAIDPDGALNEAFDDPFRNRPVPTAPGRPVMTPIATPVPVAGPPLPPAPAFIPPNAAPPPPIRRMPAAPAFIPPEAAGGADFGRDF